MRLIEACYLSQGFRVLWGLSENETVKGSSLSLPVGCRIGGKTRDTEANKAEFVGDIMKAHGIFWHQTQVVQ